MMHSGYIRKGSVGNFLNRGFGGNGKGQKEAGKQLT
jgi:hypothetical protein